MKQITATLPDCSDTDAAIQLLAAIAVDLCANPHILALCSIAHNQMSSIFVAQATRRAAADRALRRQLWMAAGRRTGRAPGIFISAGLTIEPVTRQVAERSLFGGLRYQAVSLARVRFGEEPEA